MKHYSYYTWIALLLIATISVTNASPATYSITFSAYALRPLDTSNLYYQEVGEHLTKLEFRKKSRSDHYKATIQVDDGLLRIYREQATNEAPHLRVPIGQVHIKATDAPLLLLLTQDSSEENDKISVYAVNDSITNFPQGSLRLVNISGANTLGKVGEAKFSLNNGGISQAFKQGNKENIDISVVATGNNRYHLLYKNNIRITSGSRGLLILTPPTRKGSIRIGGHLLLESPNEIKEKDL